MSIGPYCPGCGTLLTITIDKTRVVYCPECKEKFKQREIVENPQKFKYDVPTRRG